MLQTTVTTYRGQKITITREIHGIDTLLSDYNKRTIVHEAITSALTKAYSSGVGSVVRYDLRDAALKIKNSMLPPGITYKVTVELPKINRKDSREYTRHTGTYVINQVDAFTAHTAKAAMRQAVKLIRGRLDIIKKIRRIRKELRTVDISKYYRGTTIYLNNAVRVGPKLPNEFYTSKGNHYTQPGTFLRIAQEYRARLVFNSKKPLTTERHVSVEIEFAHKSSREQLGVKLLDAGVGEYVQLKNDGSVNGFGDGYTPSEIAICMPVSKRDDILRKVLGVLNADGARVNRTCGLHVHLDMRGYDHKKAFNNLVSSQVILYKMVPSSRRTNSYCQRTTNKNYDTYRSTSNRYLGINPQAFRKYNTIEVRLHSGTTDFNKVVNFVDILSAVAYNEVRIARGATTVTGFAKQHKLPLHLVNYIFSRVALFNNISQEEVA